MAKGKEVDVTVDGETFKITLGRFDEWRGPLPPDQLHSGDNYVASQVFLDSLVRNLVVESVARRQQLPTDKAISGDVQSCRDAAKILLGQDDRFHTIPFYGPGGIDVHLAKWSGVDETNPNNRVTGALVNLLTEIHGVVNQMDEYLEEQWSFQIDAIINHYVGLLMGFTPGQMAAAE